MKKETPLNPNDYTKQIAQHSQYLGNMPRDPLANSAAPEFQRQRRNAIKLGATAIARERIQQSSNEYDLEANLFNLTGHIEPFYVGQLKANAFREKYVSNHNGVPSSARLEFKEAKQHVTAFNHALKEVINAGGNGNKLTFNDLLLFITNMGRAINGRIHPTALHEMTREALIGMRNELAYEQILMAAGIDYENGTEEEDANGGDFIINGIPVDVKSSDMSARRAQERAESNGYYGDVIVWSHIDFEDFEGKLCLPLDVVDKKVPAVRSDIMRTTMSAYDRQAAGY